MALRSRSLLVLAGLFLAPAALAGPAPKAPSAGGHHPARGHLTTAKLDAPAHRAAAGRSVGSPTEGHLIGGGHLAEAPHLRIVPAYANGDARWGLEPLVNMIDHAARTVRKQFPDAVLSVGHLSRAGGGEIDRHASHESGRDADIGFYVRNQQNKTIYADHFVAFKGDGTATSWPGAQFDEPRNWALIAAIVTDPQAHVSHIFVASPLRTRLLQYAEKIGAAPAVRTRAAELMAQPRGSLPHDDHFHVRIGCPSGMEKCIEQPLARKHPRGNGSTVAQNHAAHGKPATPHTPPGHGMTPPAHHTQPSHAAPPAKHEPEASRSESLIPSLAPMIPGLDSAVIPAPLAGARPEPSEPKPAMPEAPPAAPIDDPDGVLE